jgi:transaldolase
MKSKSDKKERTRQIRLPQWVILAATVLAGAIGFAANAARAERTATAAGRVETVVEASPITPNITLCFSQEQAAAVYAATKGSKAPVYVSPFVGRLDDRGENGMDLVKNIKLMYEAGDGHVHVLAASIRHLKHLLGSFALKAELVTAPSKVWEEWGAASFPLPGADFAYEGTDSSGKGLKPIAYKSLDLNQAWESFDIRHDLTTKGIEQFVADYKGTIKQS